jgi:hypothetical protein
MTMRCSIAPAAGGDGQLPFVEHGALVAFDVQLDAGGEAVFGAVEGVARADHAVVGDGQEGATQRVEMGSGRRVGMGLGTRAALRSSCPRAPPMRWACQVCQSAGWLSK